MDELYLDNIDEYVNDHNKIVTYKWLSLTLGVHVNLAKQMLYHYLDHKRKESSAPLHATYLVSGKMVENGQTSHKVSVVREDQLEDVKSKMSVTVSVHVYSVQRAVLKDSGPLYTVDYDAVKENLKNCSKFSAIRCADAVPVAAEVQRALPPETEHAKSGINAQPSLPSKPASKQPKGIMGMFANKNASKNQESGKEIKLEQKEDAPVVVEKVRHNAMSNFFGKQAAKKPATTVKAESQTSSTLDQRPPSPPTHMDVLEEQPEEPVVAKDIRSKTKRLEHSDEEEKSGSQKKKRRRIKKPQPDSSDDDEVIPDSPKLHDVRDPSPSPERRVKKEAVSRPEEHPRSKQRKRRRVLKSRTFMDDDGCMVTEKGYESESYSEEDVQAIKQPPKGSVPARPSAGKKTHKKAAPASSKTTKQASIMGFFQKK